MIHYELRCPKGHRHSQWFASSDAFERLRDEGRLHCPECGCRKIDRALMTPAVAGRSTTPPAAAAESASVPADASPSEPCLSDERSRALRALGDAFRKAVEAEAKNVGTRFPEEARRIHYGETEPKSIYGTAEPEEARDLLEEGIAIVPLTPRTSA